MRRHTAPGSPQSLQAHWYYSVTRDNMEARVGLGRDNPSCMAFSSTGTQHHVACQKLPMWYLVAEPVTGKTQTERLWLVLF